MNNPFLIGPTIYLRPLEREDAALVQPWFNDPEVTRTMLIHRPMTLRGEEGFLDKVLQSEHDLIVVIVVREIDKAIGVTGLHQIDFKNRHASFGVSIGEKAYWGQGYGTEATALLVKHAFETMNLNRVWLHVHEYNQRGMRVYEKVGFKREGVLRQENFREGRYWDTITMAILREEWQARQRHGSLAPKE
jgi:RimJ/RimL family protein N-acetyltransferase